LKFIQQIVGLLENKNVHYISGFDQNLEMLKDVFKFNIINHVKIDNKNSWSHYEILKSYSDNIKDGEIVLISLGPTARILCYDFFKNNNKSTYIDVGSIFDPFTRNVNHNCHKGWENGFNITKRCENCN